MERGEIYVGACFYGKAQWTQMIRVFAGVLSQFFLIFINIPYVKVEL